MRSPIAAARRLLTAVTRAALPCAAALLLAACTQPGGHADNEQAKRPSAAADNRLTAAAPTAKPSLPPAEQSEQSEDKPFDSGPLPDDTNGVESPTIGGDGSKIRLMELERADHDLISSHGELWCSFEIGDHSAIMAGVGYVASKAPAHGVVRIAGKARQFTAPGGFDAMAEGTVFRGSGLTIRIGSLGKAIDDVESPHVPATMTIERADGAKRAIKGYWVCGP